ncbi:hypothetical protein FKP32DRAFT_1595388 [Trametes sanguinea]|nr:hypothetical protein FKP32DRAFT_1595388 [Trametes sanguinea]
MSRASKGPPRRLAQRSSRQRSTSRVGDRTNFYAKHLLMHVERQHVLFAPPGMGLPTALTLGADAHAEASQVLHHLVSGNRTLHQVFLDFDEHGLRTWERSFGTGTADEEKDRWNEVQESSARKILIAEDMVLYTG